MCKLYFRVSADWMKTYGFEDTHGMSKVFEVIKIHKTTSAVENIIVLRCPHTVDKEWHVFESRGHFVAPFTLVLSDGLFMPAPADVEECGADIKSHSEFDTFEAAQQAAIAMNTNIRAAHAAAIPKTLVEDIPHGAFVRRVNKDGFPMSKVYRREPFNSEVSKFPLVDPLDSTKIVFVVRGTLLVADSE